MPTPGQPRLHRIPRSNVGGTLLPLGQPFTAGAAWGTAGTRCRNQLSHRLVPVRQACGSDGQRAVGSASSQSDYADLVRQRVTETALAFYDVLEAKASLELARQDVENLERVEAVTPKGRRKRRSATGRAEPCAFGPARESTRTAGRGVGDGHGQGETASLARWG